MLKAGGVLGTTAGIVAVAKQVGRLAGRMADPHWPHRCEVANSLELSWHGQG
jgi:hypothetical protein